MFEFGYDQAAGLRAAAVLEPATVMPVAATSRPGQAYELLCTLATQLSALGQDVVIVDASAQEVGELHSSDGSHFGLIHALQDPSISGLGAAGPSAEWLVMPGAIGMRALLQTVQAAGVAVALSRLLAPFASGTVVLLYAPASALSALFAGTGMQAVVPVLALPQGTIDAYGSLKLLHAVGLLPVLAPLPPVDEPAQVPLAQVVRSVCDCAERYLGYAVAHWGPESLGLKVQEAAMGAPGLGGHAPMPERAAKVAQVAQVASNPIRWS